MKLHTQKFRVLTIKFHSQLLRTPSVEVNEKDTATKVLVRNLHYTLSKIPNAVGLAAPQIGINKRVFVIHIGNERYTFINPVIITSDAMVYGEDEGCLSIPGYCQPVPRSKSITVSYVDLAGHRHNNIPLEGFLAKVFQHEYDHLEGRLIVDYDTSEYSFDGSRLTQGP